jgi:hypothetical protein
MTEPTRPIKPEDIIYLSVSLVGTMFGDAKIKLSVTIHDPETDEIIQTSPEVNATRDDGYIGGLVGLSKYLATVADKTATAFVAQQLARQEGERERALEESKRTFVEAHPEGKADV